MLGSAEPVHGTLVSAMHFMSNRFHCLMLCMLPLTVADCCWLLPLLQVLAIDKLLLVTTEVGVNNSTAPLPRLSALVAVNESSTASADATAQHSNSLVGSKRSREGGWKVATRRSTAPEQWSVCCAGLHGDIISSWCCTDRGVR